MVSLAPLAHRGGHGCWNMHVGMMCLIGPRRLIAPDRRDEYGACGKRSVSIHGVSFIPLMFFQSPITFLIDSHIDPYHRGKRRPQADN